MVFQKPNSFIQWGMPVPVLIMAEEIADNPALDKVAVIAAEIYIKRSNETKN